MAPSSNVKPEDILPLKGKELRELLPRDTSTNTNIHLPELVVVNEKGNAHAHIPELVMGSDEKSGKSSLMSGFKHLGAYLPEIHLVDKKVGVVKPAVSDSDVEKGSYGTFKLDAPRGDEASKNILITFLASLLVVGFFVLVGVVGVGVFWF